MLNYVKFYLVVLKKKINKNAPHPVFTVSRVFSALNENWHFISAISIHLSVGMLCAKSGWNLQSVFRQEVKNVQV